MTNDVMIKSVNFLGLLLIRFKPINLDLEKIKLLFEGFKLEIAIAYLSVQLELYNCFFGKSSVYYPLLEFYASLLVNNSNLVWTFHTFHARGAWI